MKKLVIIGGGFAGSLIAKKLQSKFDTTLIDTKDYFEFTPGILRTIAEPGHIRKIQVLHTHYLHKANIITGHVKEATKKYVLINNKKIHYDYLCICSGSRYEMPMKEQDVVVVTRAAHLRACCMNLRQAKKILIIGGGIVGVELAAEISTHYNNKEITIVHAHDKLMERTPEKAGRHAEKFLKERNVKIIYNDIVEKKENRVYLTSKGRKIRADIAFLCTGIVPNYDFLEKNFKDNLNEKKHINVNEFLQVQGCRNVFAPGDINSINIEKTAQNAKYQARIVIKNILSLESNKLLWHYYPVQTPLVISLGKYNGIFTWAGFAFSGLIPGLLKTAIEKEQMFFY